MSLYPNPSTGEITVAFNGSVSRQVSFKIFDARGKTVFTSSAVAIKGPNKLHLHLQHLVSGTYYLQFNDTIDQSLVKFVIAK
jgi:hypothetical protein